MCNLWKDFVSYRNTLTDPKDPNVLSQSLIELQERQWKLINIHKMLVEKRRLGKLVSEKRKQEHISKERERAKGRDLFR